MREKVKRRGQHRAGAQCAAPETLGVNNILSKLIPALTLLPNRFLFPHSPSLAQTSSSLFYYLIEPPVLLDIWTSIRKTTFPSVPLQPSVAM